MYICLCNEITADILDSYIVLYGANYIDKLVEDYGLGNNCGTCLEGLEDEI